MVALRAGESPAATLDVEWNAGLLGCLYYQHQGMEAKEGEPVIHKIHQRMIFQGLEDPGTGSASCALACFLALTMTNDKVDMRGAHVKDDGSQVSSEIVEKTKSLSLDAKKQHYVFGIEQGVEMGRTCQICVEVDVTENEAGQRVVSAVMLSGRSAFVTKGEIIGVY